ncbi:MAG: hypothetical protein IPH35_14410 [Rhodoferax sp.]|nr:hypothetical protein [Rhodoferax sp.]
MDAAQTIRDAVARVQALRLETQSKPALLAATSAVKHFQAQRFAGAYADLLQSQEYGSAAQFFLVELYSDKDYSQRDLQFARIARGLQTFFPGQVVATAVALAELHILSEELDHQMALVWMQTETDSAVETDNVERYITAWNTVGRVEDRNRQLEMVLRMGAEIDHLTRTPGLRLMLRMMRRPANAMGLGSLQSFLEAGFDTFASMSGKESRATEFLQTIRTRESQWFARLFSTDRLACVSELRACLAAATTPALTPVLSAQPITNGQ